jgi:hypothetical protein
MTEDVRMPTFAEAQEQEAKQTVIPKDIRALELLQMEYRGEIALSHNRRQSAMKCLEFETPKLGVVATISNGDDLAAMLDRAIERAGLKLIEHVEGEGKGEGSKSPTPTPAPLPPHGTPRVGPTPDRRFRRS